MPAEPPVWILDTSALIEFKRLLPMPEQWNAFVRLGSLVENGRIAMPRQVLAEATRVSHPDVPGAWAAAMRERLQHTLDPGYHFIRTSHIPPPLPRRVCRTRHQSAGVCLRVPQVCHQGRHTRTVCLDGTAAPEREGTILGVGSQSPTHTKEDETWLQGEVSSSESMTL